MDRQRRVTVAATSMPGDLAARRSAPGRRRSAAWVLALGCATAAVTIQAQPGSEEIVVVGSRLARDGFGPRNVIVRDREEIERQMPGDAEQLLRRVPGVSLYRTGGAGGVSEIFVRGGESNFTAVYLDGVRVNDTTNTRGGSFDFSTLPAFRLGRLELAPGAMSAIYGSDTMAGVIRIESAWPAAGELSARAEIGSESDRRAGLGYAFALGDDIELGLIGSASDAGDEVPGSMLETADFGARLRIGRVGGAEWKLIARFAERERSSFPEVSGGPVLAVLRDLETSEAEQASFSAHASWTFTDDWSAELTVSNVETKDDYRSPPIAPGMLDGQPAFSTRTDFDRTELLFVNRYRIAPSLHAAFGADLIMESGRDDGAIDLGGMVLPAAYELDRDTRSAFVEIGKSFDTGFDAAIALRTDRTGGDSEVSGKLDVSKQWVAADARIWASVANGFKLPSFFALGNPLYGNTELAPEQVESLEIGFEHQPAERISYGVSVFRNAYEDLIDFDFETFTSINRATVDIDGVQSRLSLALTNSLTISVDATLLSIETGAGSSTLPRRPERVGGVSVERSFGQGWSVAGAIRHVGARTISSIPTGSIEDGGYELANLVFRKDAARGRSFWIALDNLLDADYRQAPGFPAPGARIRIGAAFVH